MSSERHGRTPNHDLERTLTASGASRKSLAKRINELAKASETPTHYTHTSVGNWLAGMTPTWPTPRLIATVLGERLGQRVTLADIGMAHTEPIKPDNMGLEFPRDLPDAITVATGFWSSMKRRKLPAVMFTTMAMATPMSRWLIQPADPSVANTGGRRVGKNDIAQLRQAAEDAQRYDVKFGGGSSGASLASVVLRDTAAPLLSGTYSDEIGRELFAACAELSRVAGFAAADMHQHGLAQRYYVQALRMARAAGDPALGGYILVTMAIQALTRDEPSAAIDMAQAATERAKHVATPRTLAFYAAIEARAHARDGDRRAAEHALATAETLLSRARPGQDPPWIRYNEFGRLAGDATEAYCDLRMPDKVQQWGTHAALPAGLHVRANGMLLTILARGRLQAGELDEALALTRQAVEILAHVTSERARAHIRAFLSHLTPWQNESKVQATIRYAAAHGVR
ncbi:sporulation protein [Nonomuraea sp. NPDC046802]|uniref:sporulation protein n=1 Tax=Nonomuraea sp. NPDC046802 TaxID=3154919 RepID=UPI0033E4C032